MGVVAPGKKNTSKLKT